MNKQKLPTKPKLSTFQGRRTDYPFTVYADEEANFSLNRELVPVEVIARFTIDGEPVSKSRARFTKRGSKMVAYTPEKTKAAEEAVAWAFKQAAPGWQPDSDSAFGVAALFFADTRQRRDVDNMIKLICDGLNKIAWADDSQVHEVSGRRGYDQPGNARTEVMIYRTGKIPRNQKPCLRCETPFDVYASTTKQKFCSRECAYAYRRENRKRVCDACGNEFHAPTKNTKQKYCSETCRVKAKRLELHCIVCGNGYTAPRSLAPKQIKVCSQECRTEYWRKQRRTAAKGTCQDCGGPTSKKSYTRCAPCSNALRSKQPPNAKRRVYPSSDSSCPSSTPPPPAPAHDSGSKSTPPSHPAQLH